MVTVVDNFLDERMRVSLLQQLPPLEGGACRALPTVMVPSALEDRMHHAVRHARDGGRTGAPAPPVPFGDGGELVPVPARLASGSVPMHKDCFNPFDAAEHLPIEDHVAILYLDGAGQLVIGTGAGEEEVVDVVPGRLVAWPNGACYHRFDAPPGGGVRAMLGPLAVDAEGRTQRAHDVWSTHPGYIGYCQTNARAREAAGDHEGAIRELRNIGIPALAEQLVREYEECRVAKQKMLVVTLTAEPGAAVGEYDVVCTGLSGRRMATMPVPNAATFKSVEPDLVKALIAEAGEKVFPRFVVGSGVLSEEAHGELCLLDCITEGKASSSAAR